MIYLGVSFLLATLFTCGILIIRRTSNENRLQVLLPSGVIIGVAIYIFFLNIIAHFIKGKSGFLIAWFSEVIFTIFIAYLIRSKSRILLPLKKELFLWIISVLFWSILLYSVTSSSPATSGDAVMHYSLASLFSRGDFPLHVPWQPDYISYYHIGGAELLGATKSLTGAPYQFQYSLLSFIFLLAVSQVLTWILNIYNKKASPLIFFLIASVGIISLGGFMLAWPFKLTLPEINGGIISWLGNLPTFYNSFEIYGAATSLASLILFFHRMLALSFFVGLLPLILRPDTRNILPTSLLLIIILSVIALTDESVFIIITPAVCLVSLISIFKFSFRKWLIVCLIIILTTALQGGMITQAIFNKNGTRELLIFPSDQTGILAKYHSYRSYRLAQQASKLIPDEKSYYPLRWFHPGIVWQLTILLFLLILSQFLFPKEKRRSLNHLMELLLLTSVFSLISFHGLVPKGYLHNNGNRFLALSYQLSGLGIVFFIVYWFNNLRTRTLFARTANTFIKALVVWVLFFSIIPPLANLFPRPRENWFIIKLRSLRPEFVWIKNNISLQKRILMLDGITERESTNLELITEVGALTPIWSPQPRSFYGSDTSPIYIDVFYTLNPQLLKILKVDYIVISNQYLANLPKKRIAEINNSDFFRPVYKDPSGNITILQITPKYISEGENYGGTLYELSQIASNDGSYYIDYLPNIKEHIYRSVRLILNDREVYHDPHAAFYNYQIDIDLKYYGDPIGNYNYLILDKDTYPKSICNCSPKLLWEGLGNNLKLWKTDALPEK